MTVKKLKGFSILEVIVVITVLGLLAAISLPSYQKTVLKGHERAAIGNLLSMQAAVKIYLINSGSAVIPEWNDLNAINNGLKLRITDPLMAYRCGGSLGGRTNVCTAVHPSGWGLVFHDEHSSGLIHCRGGTACPSCPFQPGNCQS